MVILGASIEDAALHNTNAQLPGPPPKNVILRETEMVATVNWQLVVRNCYRVHFRTLYFG